MTLDEVMSQLAAKGSEATKRIFAKHGAKEPFFGVKVADLKVIQRALRDDQALALRLFATGNGDAQYLAGLIARGDRMTPAQLHSWAQGATWCMISANTVPWVASEHPEGLALALRWIESPTEGVAVAGWRTLGALATVLPADRPTDAKFGALLDRIARDLPKATDEVRLAMNGFVIACGTYVAALGARAIATARKVGRVEADMGETACKIPDAEAAILKGRRGASVAPKRKTVRC
jgi:hypothetical protein